MADEQKAPFDAAQAAIAHEQTARRQRLISPTRRLAPFRQRNQINGCGSSGHDRRELRHLAVCRGQIDVDVRGAGCCRRQGNAQPTCCRELRLQPVGNAALFQQRRRRLPAASVARITHRDLIQPGQQPAANSRCGRLCRGWQRQRINSARRDPPGVGAIGVEHVSALLDVAHRGVARQRLQERLRVARQRDGVED